MSGRPHRATNDYAGPDFAIIDYAGDLQKGDSIADMAKVCLVCPIGEPHGHRKEKEDSDGQGRPGS